MSKIAVALLRSLLLRLPPADAADRAWAEAKSCLFPTTIP